MKLAIFDNLPEGGAKRVVYEQIRKLCINHQITYFTNNEPSRFPFSTLPISLVRFSNLDHRLIASHSAIWQLWWMSKHLPMVYKDIAEDINAGTYDAVILHHCRFTQTPLLTQYLNLPTLYYVEEPLRLGSEPKLHPLPSINPIKQQFERVKRKKLLALDAQAFEYPTQIITNSKFTQANVSAYYQRKSKVIYPGVDTHVFGPISFKQTHRKPYFLFVGEKHDLNGWDLVQRALTIEPNFEVRVVAMKDGRLAMSDSQMAKIYSGAVATLCLARREPFGLSAIESIACQTPVIALYEGGYKETVVEGMGWFVEAGDFKALVKIMKEAISQPIRKHLHLASKFSWEYHVQQLEIELKVLTHATH